ncbi:hypothetical protein MPER_10505 [Moniliophthora perniciosa FA553]|nr:hypothetical protein MPER_10505 [Moniliophthora perniciosa FA553]
MAFNRSKVNVTGDAVNIVYGGQINYAHGTVSQNLDDPDPSEYTDPHDRTTLITINHSSSGESSQTACTEGRPQCVLQSEQRYPPPNCHPGTRTRTLEELSQWIEDDSKATKVFWLYGSAGVGKSAIAQNLAEKYAGKKVAAAFFFSRNDSSRDKLNPFVASIAHQLTTTDPRLRSVLGPAIVEAIRPDCNVFSKSCEHQFQQLIIKPCAKVDVTKLDGLPNTIIVDGLDECIDHPSQARLLAMIRKVATRRISEFPIPWVFLIFSRPEPQIRRAFSDFGAILRSYDVNTLDDAYRDIHRYFVDRFAELRQKHRALRHEDKSWPNHDKIYQLAKRADKQNIFAATVIKYIDTDDELPQDRLATILCTYVERESDSPYSDLDLLYHQILSTCRRWEKVQAVLCLLVSPHSQGKGSM